jgi:hypothetical protein
MFSKSFNGQPLIKNSPTTLLTTLLDNRNKKISSLGKLLVNTDYQRSNISSTGELLIGLEKAANTSDTQYTSRLENILLYGANDFASRWYGNNNRSRPLDPKPTMLDNDNYLEYNDSNGHNLLKHLKPVQISKRYAIATAPKNIDPLRNRDIAIQNELLVSPYFSSPGNVKIKQNPVSYNSDIIMLVDEEYENYRDLFETDTHPTDEIFGIRTKLSLSDYLDPLDSMVDDAYAEYYKITSKDYSDSSTNYDKSTTPLTDTAYFEINDTELSSARVTISHRDSVSYNATNDAISSEPSISDLLKRISESYVGDVEIVDSPKSSYAKTTNKYVNTDTSSTQSLESADLIGIDLDSETTEIVSTLGTNPYRHSKENIYFESLAFIGIQDADESDDSEIYESMVGPMHEESITQ